MINDKELYKEYKGYMSEFGRKNNKKSLEKHKSTMKTNKLIQSLLFNIKNYFKKINYEEFENMIENIEISTTDNAETIYYRIVFKLNSENIPFFPENDIITLSESEDIILIKCVIFSDFGISNIANIRKKNKEINHKEISDLEKKIIIELSNHLNFIKLIK